MGRGGAPALWPPWSYLYRAGPLAAPGVWGEKRAAGSIRALNAPPRLDSAAFVPYWGARAPERVRAISTARLCTSPCLHLRPIDVIVSDGPYINGDLILGGASCLDAFSTYPGRTRLPGGAPGGTTGSPEVRPTRSSRTSVGAPQISCAHNR